MGMFRNWKVRRLRKRIINDPRLSEWEKDEAIRKLDEKEQSLVRVEPVYPERLLNIVGMFPTRCHLSLLERFKLGV